MTAPRGCGMSWLARRGSTRTEFLLHRKSVNHVETCELRCCASLKLADRRIRFDADLRKRLPQELLASDTDDQQLEVTNEVRRAGQIDRASERIDPRGTAGHQLLDHARSRAE